MFYTVITSSDNLKYLHKSIFQKYTILLFESSASKEYLEDIEMIVGENKTWVLFITCLVIKTSLIFHTAITIRDMHEKRCCKTVPIFRVQLGFEFKVG